MTNPNEKQHDFDVLIAGGGPVGATLAGYLGERGISTLLVEAGDGVVRDCRMHLVNIRSMEILRNLGLENELRHCGWPLDYVQDISFVTHLDGWEIGRIPWPAIRDMSPPEYSPTFGQRCPQFWFNPIVLAYAQRQPDTTIRYHTRLEQFESDADGVLVELSDGAGKRSKVYVKYLIGCDGPRSTVRKQMSVVREGAKPLGQSVEVVFRSPDLARHMKMGPAGRFVMVNKRGLSANLMPFDGIDRYRMSLLVQPSDLTLEQMHEEIRALTLAPFEFEILTPLLPWVNRSASASTYVKGRVILAGDAAHSMPPTGGFGMNSGIQDIYDLGWRLKALVDGWGGPALLESYDVERRTAIARVGAMASSVYEDWVEWNPKLREIAPRLEQEGPDGEAFRAQIGAELVSTFRREFNVQGGPLGYRYNDSPAIVPDGTLEPPDSMGEYVQVARPGHRAPHMWLHDGRSTLDLFGDAFTLLDTTGDVDSTRWEDCAASLSVPLQVVHLAEAQAREIFGSGQVLVRPDGIVCWRSDRSPLNIEQVFFTVTGRGQGIHSRCDADLSDPAADMSELRGGARRPANAGPPQGDALTTI